ncbi:condensation protein [Rhodococcus sp. Leaf7]|uniref:condensation domain-containing protein n=1 Tax=unclassified Rhodococcus (in: high G+C Gram-positive bacteria) TaxID=192944 RepID=UPI0005AC5290|nr:condensation domain-containing protein [Rhodococcus sp. Leaf247]KIQ19568.1 condensation protein [Rhodococcus sp. MEB064]KQU06317.1 condensation protein [Rhodococcus sp. Leaf7]KQU41834.1 condensation protein [Rhodococcus sp. Leaf247]
MEFTELVDYPIPAGTITEWIPSVGPHASTPEDAGWLEDDRPTSFVHEAHLRRTIADPSAGRESWLGTAFDIPGTLDKAAFRRAVLAWIDRHEGMRSNATIDPDSGVLSRVTAPVGATDIWVIQQDECTRADEVYEHLQHLFDEYTSPLVWPSYAFVTLEPRSTDDVPDHVTVFFAADHSIIDGLSIVLIAHELTRLYEEETTGVHAGLFPTGSYLDFGELERTLCSGVDHTHDAAVEWSRFLAENGGQFPSFPLDIGPAPEVRVPQNGLSAWIMTPEEAESFTVACRKTGPGFLAGLMAAMGAASYAVSGAPRFRTVTPMHTRHDPSWAASLGWFVGVAPLAFDVADGESFGDLVVRAGSELARTKPVSKVPFDLIADATGVDVLPRFVVSFMDVRFAPDARTWPDINARALRSKKYDHDVYLWIHRTPQGVNISSRFAGTEVAAAAVHRFVGELRAVLTAVASTGTYLVHAPETPHLDSETRMSI